MLQILGKVHTLFIYLPVERNCAQYIQFFILFPEPERKLLLSEKGGGEIGTDKSCVVTAAQNFHFIGTMNPGGDYGKKEVCVWGIIQGGCKVTPYCNMFITFVYINIPL
jgi:hypothetical protein